MWEKKFHTVVYSLLALFLCSSISWAQVDTKIKIRQYDDPKVNEEVKRGDLKLKSTPKDIVISIGELGIKSKKDKDIWLAESVPAGTYTVTVWSMDREYSYEFSIDPMHTTEIDIDLAKNSFAQTQVAWIDDTDHKSNVDYSNEIFATVEEMPKFQGKHNLEYFRKYIQDRIVYPENEENKHLKGAVFAKFVVTKEGQIDQIEILRSLSPALDAEVVRVMKESPKWSPAMRRGKPVNIAMSIPVKFN